MTLLSYSVWSHTCFSNASSFQGKCITEVKLQYITQHKAQCHQITCQSWTVGKGTYTQMLRLRCANILGVLLDRNRVTVIEFTVMVSAKQPSQLWQIGRPSGPISLALISVRILTSASDVNSRGLKGGYEP